MTQNQTSCRSDHHPEIYRLFMQVHRHPISGTERHVRRRLVYPPIATAQTIGQRDFAFVAQARSGRGNAYVFDIHKVKPVHGWREFLGEVGIIVLGVLIALALEQAVEWFHWRHMVDQATEALHETVALSSLPAIEQEVTSTCVDRQLIALEKHLLADGAYQPLPLNVDGSKLPFVLRAPQRPWGNGTWRVLTQEGVATHLDARLREQTDAIYAGFDVLSGLSHENSQDLWKINSLALPAFTERSERNSMVQVIEMIRGRNALMTISAAQLLGHVKEIGMLPTKSFVDKHVYHESGTIDYCHKLGLPLEPIWFRHVG